MRKEPTRDLGKIIESGKTLHISAVILLKAIIPGKKNIDNLENLFREVSES